MFGLAWLTWVFSIVSVQHCSFIKMGPANVDYDSLDAMGFFHQAYYDDKNRDFLGCIKYEVDASWSGTFLAARFFSSFLALLSTLLLVMVNLMIIFIRAHSRRRLFHSIIRVLVPIAFLCSIFTLAVFSTDECKKDDFQCPPGAGGVVAIINTFVLAVLTVLVFLAPTPSQPVFVLFRVEETKKHKKQVVTFQDPREPRPERWIPKPERPHSSKSKKITTSKRNKSMLRAPSFRQAPPSEATSDTCSDRGMSPKRKTNKKKSMSPPSPRFRDAPLSETTSGIWCSDQDHEMVEAVGIQFDPDVIDAGRRTRPQSSMSPKRKSSKKKTMSPPSPIFQAAAPSEQPLEPCRLSSPVCSLESSMSPKGKTSKKKTMAPPSPIFQEVPPSEQQLEVPPSEQQLEPCKLSSTVCSLEPALPNTCLMSRTSPPSPRFQEAPPSEQPLESYRLSSPVYSLERALPNTRLMSPTRARRFAMALDTSSDRTEDMVDRVDIQVDMIPAGRRTIATVTHPDGSKTMTCKIKELSEFDRMDHPGVV
jgi:hypothetical protein